MPLNTKTFRVFVSSTFTDMRVERRILQEKVFPKLKALCESKGATFQDVDLRWGVNEEAQLDQKTMDICLGEIARCQRLSPKPNFIVLLGDKYGWQPIPARIPSSEMDLIREKLPEAEMAILSQWYREDLNAVPPEYVLQPREGEHRSYEHWQPIEEGLRAILRRTAAQLPFSEAQRVKYFASATHQEILAGALNPPHGVPDPEEHVFAYLRTIRDLPEDLSARNFTDLSGNDVDPYARSQLEELRIELANKLPPDHIHHYGAHWDNGCTLDDSVAFAARVYDDLKSVIESQLQEIEEVDPFNEEIQRHEEFKKQRLEHFAGRLEALSAMRNYLDSDVNKVFSIIGPSGSGKTSLIAKAIEEAEVRNAVIVYRFIGTTAVSSNTFRLLSDIIKEIAQGYGTEPSALLREAEETKLTTVRGLQEIVPRCIGLATKEKRLFVFLDSLDQLGQDQTSLELGWIPREIPENTRIVVSTLPELKDRLNHTVTYDLSPMPEREGEELLDAWLASANRTLQPSQKREVLDKFASNGTPLYLKLAFERARAWHSYSPDCILSPDNDGMLDAFFDQLERDHGSFLVQKVCGYLLSGKYQGLMEQEILDLLVIDQEHWRPFVDHCHPAQRNEVEYMGKLPIVVWSRLFLDLDPYLTEREADGLPIISFYHREFAMHITTRCHLSHSTLADYFEQGTTDRYSEGEEVYPDLRRLSELPYQLHRARSWKRLEMLFLSAPFVESKCQYQGVYSLLEDCYRVLAAGETGAFPGDLIPIVTALSQILRGKAYHVQMHPGIWLQQTYNGIVSSHLNESAFIPLIEGIMRLYDQRRMPWFKLLSSDFHKTRGSDDQTVSINKTNQTNVRLFTKGNTVVFSTDSDFCHLSLSPNKRVAAVVEIPLGRPTGAVSLWDLRWGRRVSTVSSFEFPIIPAAIAWFADSRRLLVALSDGDISVRDSETNLDEAVWSLHKPIVNAALSSDGLTVVVLTEGRALVCDPLTGEQWMTCGLSHFTLDQVVMSLDSSFAILGGKDTIGSLVLLRWNLLTGVLSELASFHYGAGLSALCLSSDDLHIACGDLEGSVHVLTTKTGLPVCSFSGHTAVQRHSWASSVSSIIAHDSWVQCVAFSEDGARLVSGSGMPRGHHRPGELCIWNPGAGVLLDRRRVSSGVSSIAWVGGDEQVLVAGQEHFAIEPLSITGRSLELDGGNYVTAVAFSPDGARRAVAQEGEILFSEGENTFRISAHAGRIESLAWDPYGYAVMSGGKDGKCKLWDSRDGQLLGEIPSPWLGVPIKQVAFSSAGSFGFLGEQGIVVCAQDRTLLNTKAPPDAELVHFCYSPDAMHLALAISNSKVEIWDLMAQKCEMVIETQGVVTDMSYGTSRELLTAHLDGKCKCWDLVTGKQVFEAQGHLPFARMKLFCHPSLPGRLLSFGGDKICRLWVIDGLKQIGCLPLETWVAEVALLTVQQVLLVVDMMGNELQFSLNELLTE